MSGKEQEKSESWLSTIFEGGLPQIIAGPAGKAFSRLIGATIEIPASYVDGIAQGVKDKTAAKSLVANAIAERAAIMAVEDSEIMGRAVDSLLASQYRKQENKEEIVKLAIEDLNETPPSSDSQGPSDDWMNKFERYAEDASSDELRLMYAKLLAGEIRKEKSVSAATLHFVSLLDNDVTNLIERVLPYASNEGFVFQELVKPELTYLERTVLEQSGFWTMDKRITLTHDDDGKLIYEFRDGLGFYTEAAPSHKTIFIGSVLSKAGRDLAQTINRGFEITALCKLLYTKGATRAAFGEYSKNGNRVALSNMFDVPADAP
ncbi:DUF2806 domain-containing protein [Nioella sp.]|uniref:DUF2806 domain-containing protein n=1 Tax=Nioella sp. TaxID=1912091 RepID=UPI003B51A44E